MKRFLVSLSESFLRFVLWLVIAMLISTPFSILIAVFLPPDPYLQATLGLSLQIIALAIGWYLVYRENIVQIRVFGK